MALPSARSLTDQGYQDWALDHKRRRRGRHQACLPPPSCGSGVTSSALQLLRMHARLDRGNVRLVTRTGLATCCFRPADRKVPSGPSTDHQKIESARTYKVDDSGHRMARKDMSLEWHSFQHCKLFRAVDDRNTDVWLFPFFPLLRGRQRRLRIRHSQSISSGTSSAFLLKCLAAYSVRSPNPGLYVQMRSRFRCAILRRSHRCIR